MKTRDKHRLTILEEKLNNLKKQLIDKRVLNKDYNPYLDPEFIRRECYSISLVCLRDQIEAILNYLELEIKVIPLTKERKILQKKGKET